MLTTNLKLAVFLFGSCGGAWACQMTFAELPPDCSKLIGLCWYFDAVLLSLLPQRLVSNASLWISEPLGQVIFHMTAGVIKVDFDPKF